MDPRVSTFAMAPATDEYAEFYAGYVGLVPDGNILLTLEGQVTTTADLLRDANPDRASYQYAPGKWTLRQAVLHLIDTERVMAYRALQFARGDSSPLPGMDQNQYAAIAVGERFSLVDLASMLERLRASSIDLFLTFDEAAMNRRGMASGYDVSVRALIWIIAGHERHHLKIIRERYLG